MLQKFSKLSTILLVLVFSSITLSAGELSAYYSAKYKDASSVKTALKKEGFKVLSTYSPAKKDYLKVISFTNNNLIAMASKPKRGFAAVQKVLIDTKKKTLITTNPSYWLRAFLQGDFKGGDKELTVALTKALGELKGTSDKLKSSSLAKYHFMMAMPYYQDMLELKSGVKSVKSPLYSVKLKNGSTLYGVKMSKASESFISKIGEDKALVLPYTILVENGTAYALHAKYYLAISYPKLSMGQFMKISSVPDTIERKLKKSVK